MIDVHSHLVYGVDDGSRELAETIAMLQEAKEAGFTDIILTPHYMEDYYMVPCKDIADCIVTMKEEAQKIGIQLYQGNEIYATENIVDLLNTKEAMSLNGSRYVLFELPMQNMPMNLDQVIYLLLEAGKVPIIAHPERYKYVQEDPNMLLDYIDRGVLFQSNFGSISGRYGKEIKETVKKLLTHNMIHFLGSDNHHTNAVYTEIPETMPILQKWIGEKKIEELTVENPRSILQNEEIEIDDPEEIAKKSWKFWK